MSEIATFPSSYKEIVDRASSTYHDLNISIIHTIGGRQFPVIVSRAMIDEALSLRVESKSVAQIATIMDVTPSIAQALVKEGLRHIELETTDEMRKLEASKFDVMEQVALAVLMADQEEGSAAAKGRILKAIEVLLKISGERRKLLGLDAPTVVEHTPVELKINGVNIEDV